MRFRGLVAGCVLTTALTPATAVSARPMPASTTRSLAAPAACPGCWHPAVRVSWQWQLQEPPKVGALLGVMMYDVDGFETSKRLVAAMHAKGIKAVCYLSVGSWERYRPDANDVPSSVLGKSNGWPGERWLDIRKLAVLKPIMRARMDRCRRKGFDAIEFDKRRRLPERDRVPAERRRPAALRRVPRERGACARPVRVPQERPGTDPEAAPVLRRGP